MTESNYAYEFEVEDVRGFPGTIVNDLERSDAQQADHVELAYDEDEDPYTVTVRAESDVALKLLYDFLETEKQYYRSEYVDASGEHDAAEDLADAVYEVMSS